jgi:hypothetical protein
VIGARHAVGAQQRAAIDFEPDHGELPILKTKAGIAGGSKTEKRIGPMSDGKNFLSMECAHGIRFSVRRLCETNHSFDVRVPKTIGAIEDLRPSMHANLSHSQAAAAHNCVSGMAVDLFRWMVERRRN